MKGNMKSLSYLVVLLFSVSLLTGCSDDNDEQVLIPAEDINGTYENGSEVSLLSLTYSGEAYTGGSVKFTTSDNKTATLILTDVIPGSTEVTIEGIQLAESEDAYTFSGSSTFTRATSGSIEYSGSVRSGSLTLSLNVTMPDPSGWAGTYRFADVSIDATGGTETSACYCEVTGGNDGYQYWFRPILGLVLPQVLDEITLSADGNVVAGYNQDAVQFPADADGFMGLISGGFSQDVVDGYVAGRSYVDSPKNLAYWIETDGSMLVKLNAGAIVSQALSSGSNITIDFSTLINSILDTDATGLRELLGNLSGLLGDNATLVTTILNSVDDSSLNTLLGWVKNGFPLNVEQVDGHTHIYIDREVMSIVVGILANEDVMALITGMLPEEYQMAAGLISQFVYNWDTTTEFKLGLDLVK